LLIVAFARSTDTGERMLTGLRQGLMEAARRTGLAPRLPTAAPNTILPESMIHRISQSRCRVGKMRIRENARTDPKL
jgi:hypothetical protein